MSIEPENLVFQISREMRAELAGMRADLSSMREEMADKAELKAEIDSLRADIASEFALLQAMMAGEHKLTREQIEELRLALADCKASFAEHQAGPHLKPPLLH